MSLRTVKAANAAMNIAGKSAVVIGGTSGIGQAIAIRLAEAGVSVTVVGRNPTRGNQTVAEMTQKGNGKHNFVQCDASLLKSATQFADDFKKSHNVLDFLVMTQGIATIQGFTPTAEGIDVKLALHYYSRVKFALELMPLLEKSDDARVLSVLSAGYHSAYKDYEKNPDLSKSYSLSNAANAAGFYNDIAADKLSEEHPTVTFLHAAPGAIKTNWGTEMPFYLRGPIRFLQLFLTSASDCAEYMVSGLVDPAKKGGFHLMLPSAKPASATSKHDEARDFVWSHTKEMMQKGANEENE